MVHGATALFSLVVFHLLSLAVFNFSPDYPSMYILGLCLLSSLLVGSAIAARSIALGIKLIPHTNACVLRMGLDSVALVNALATVTFISISNGAQGLIAAFIISPLVRSSFCRLVSSPVRSFSHFLLPPPPHPPTALSRCVVSFCITPFLCGCSR